MTGRAGLLWALVAVFLGALAWGVFHLAPGGEAKTVRATLSAAAAISGNDTVGFARATEPRPFVEPDDHGPHPEFRTEWWYFTGNLTGSGGRPFAYQLTFFRSSLSPDPPARESEWSTNQVWMAHFAITDVEGNEHRSWEKFARGAAGLAGGEAEPFRVWVEGWSATGGNAEGVFPLRLLARDDGWELDLSLDSGKPRVAQGEAGLSRKGPEPGNASYYFSYTRMPTRGWMRVGGDRLAVDGESWLDREWSTSALGSRQVGWDWFSLQLSDGRELMYFELRRDDGSREPFNQGSLVDRDGRLRPLGPGDVSVEVTGSWTSPLDGTRYPSGWRLRVPAEGIDLALTPRIPDQEMNLSFRYWEGAVKVRGVGGDRPIEGVGFVELTGYGGG